MTRKTWPFLLGSFVVSTLLAAACGGSSEDEDDDESSSSYGNSSSSRGGSSTTKSGTTNTTPATTTRGGTTNVTYTGAMPRGGSTTASSNRFGDDTGIPNRGGAATRGGATGAGGKAAAGGANNKAGSSGVAVAPDGKAGNVGNPGDTGSSGGQVSQAGAAGQVVVGKGGTTATGGKSGKGNKGGGGTTTTEATTPVAGSPGSSGAPSTGGAASTGGTTSTGGSVNVAGAAGASGNTTVPCEDGCALITVPFTNAQQTAGFRIALPSEVAVPNLAASSFTAKIQASGASDGVAVRLILRAVSPSVFACEASFTLRAPESAWTPVTTEALSGDNCDDTTGDYKQLWIEITSASAGAVSLLIEELSIQGTNPGAGPWKFDEAKSIGACNATTDVICRASSSGYVEDSTLTWQAR